uniref:Ring finger protein 151 n=1 Tax=Erpetoichthys calabaricus TaxID=27687 RepID=A0A8C4SXG2_ERPCA
ICTICHGVMRCPVRIVCKHIFCKRCILQWLRSCPYCRKPVHKEMVLVMYRLCRSISRLQIKCKNYIHGCLATFPLAEQCKHLTSCDFEVTGCTNEGCEVEVLRKDLAAHVQSCEFWRRPCSMGCGEILTHQTLSHHNCYRALKREFDAQQRTHKLRNCATSLGWQWMVTRLHLSALQQLTGTFTKNKKRQLCMMKYELRFQLLTFV